PRRLSLQAFVAVAGLIAACVRAVAMLARRRPAVVVSVGGYAALPAAVAAVLLRVPLVVAEQNAVPGAVNRLTARFARASAVSFEGTPLPRAVLTGNPIREEVARAGRSPESRERARQALGLPQDRTVVLATGGSLGSLRINEAVAGAARGAWAARPDLAVRHVVGRRDWPRFSGGTTPSPHAGGLVYQAVSYEDRMPTAYAAADLAVCRAGATTVSELAAAGLPAVLVPLPGAPGDHQTANARAVARLGGAVVVPDPELSTERLVAEVDALLSVPGRLEGMARDAYRLARPDAADRLAELAERHAARRAGEGGGG
ncbi:MAG TPA: UDP-N-acetylglucosamine--N-acetylmuramyl-(pentapeptide) pyrophosphoryl-undecaprenol N-acetylglucosamine transferase, partial [Acidimicrobiales bacterium]|nr:UDP-N-acetylglucosamine--N-acetylmuramyl-(pentapeptide) pyrophosphoryl-undecaprenol N-acetylglucosamine transferase [Acidimicrobiales bacterium]